VIESTFGKEGHNCGSSVFMNDMVGGRKGGFGDVEPVLEHVELVEWCGYSIYRFVEFEVINTYLPGIYPCNWIFKCWRRLCTILFVELLDMLGEHSSAFVEHLKVSLLPLRCCWETRAGNLRKGAQTNSVDYDTHTVEQIST
jgi:hypothetical protein